MAFLIGMDEAGYGPNLGPLVVGASVWHVPGDARAADLYRLLADAVAAPAVRGDGDGRLVIGDSKAVYQPSAGLGRLERGVLSAAACSGHAPWSWHDVWRRLSPGSAADLADEPWHRNYALELPLANDQQAIGRDALRLRAGCAAAGVRLLGLRSRAVFPARFNRLVAQLGNKASLLSHVSLELLAEAMAPLRDEPVLALCDKHGGRNTYGPLVQRHFPDHLVQCRGEGRAASVYRFGSRDGRHEVRFLTRGEAELPVALASMVAKYLRELAMRAFNDFWQARVPRLRPTAGYPADARRFKREIADAQAALALADDVVWRAR